MQFDRNNSPVIWLPSPHENIILTPPRITDAAEAIECLNHPSVYMNLAGPPFPYTQANFEEWNSILSRITAGALSEYKEMQQHPGKRWVGQLPVSAIREVNAENGEERFIGEVALRRRNYISVSDIAERTRLEEENEALEAGDPKIDWTLGFYLSPSYGGRGIMSAVVRTLMHEFMIPYMNLHRSTCAFFEHNVASRRVFEKNGFSHLGWFPEVVEMPEAKTGVKGKKVGLGVVEWERDLARK